MIRWLIHLVLPVCCLIGFQQAHAMGLGELRRQPLLGERLDLQIELVGVEKSPPDVACFRIISPRDPSDLPWVKRAELRVRQGGGAGTGSSFQYDCARANTSIGGRIVLWV